MSSKNTNANYAVALGNFDGVHIGHQQVIKTTKQKAAELGCKSAVITFSPHPAHILSTQPFHEILSSDEKIKIIKDLGIDEVIIINFDQKFAEMPAESFINDICQKWNIKSITTGYNFRFGYNRQGDINTINKLKNRYNFKYNAINQVLHNGCEISSSILRKVIKTGCIRLFSDFTNRYYTINCTLHNKVHDLYIFDRVYNQLLLPPDGVYLGETDGNYVCLFLNKSQLTVKPIDCEIESENKIKLIQILGQEISIDNLLTNSVEIESYMKKAKFCLI